MVFAFHYPICIHNIILWTKLYNLMCSKCPFGLSYCDRKDTYNPLKPYCCRYNDCEDNKNYC